jgi:hypothetical protein
MTYESKRQLSVALGILSADRDDVARACGFDTFESAVHSVAQELKDIHAAVAALRADWEAADSECKHIPAGFRTAARAGIERCAYSKMADIVMDNDLPFDKDPQNSNLEAWCTLGRSLFLGVPAKHLNSGVHLGPVPFSGN